MDPTADAKSDSVPPTSLWARAAGAVGEPDASALRELAGVYWYCAYAWWRRAGLDAVSSATATLASFEFWLGESPPKPGDSGAARMRDWMEARLRELAAQGVKLKGEPPIPIDRSWAEKRYAEEPVGDPGAIFQRRWAFTVIENAGLRLREEYKARNEGKLHAELMSFAGFGQADSDRYTSVARKLGQTAGAIRKAVFDFRNRQRDILHQLVSDTVLDTADADSEITALLCACDATGQDTSSAPLPSVLQGVRPDEILARAMRSVKMTTGGAGGWQPPTIEEAALLFPQYEVVALIGRGGMGAVYKGRQVELDRPVAIKLLPLEVSIDPDFADRFRREARAMAKLNHPNIILIHEFGSTFEGHLFFVMEYVEGADLHQMIHGPGVMPDQALAIISGVCDALAYAHGKGVVHRDIKPANVMVSITGEVKVADFGLARLLDPGAEQLGHTVTGTVMGTPDYMAPEQMRGMNVDHRADIYSLGVMLYEMLCGEVPRGIFDPPSVRVPGVSAGVDQVVIKAMQQQPDRRYQSTAEMKTDVAVAAGPKPVVHKAPKPALAPKPLVPPKQAAFPAKPVPKPEPKPMPVPAAKPRKERAVGVKSRKPIYIAAAAAVVVAILGFSLLSGPGRSKSGGQGDQVGGAVSHTETDSLKPKQTIDLIALTDPVKDVITARYTGANRWTKSAGKLVYEPDGKMGKVDAPVALNATDYEIEFSFRQTKPQGSARLLVDLPLDAKPTSLPLILNDSGQKIIHNRQGDNWPEQATTSGTIVIRCRMARAPGEQDHVVVSLDGKTVTNWKGSLVQSSTTTENHPSFPQDQQKLTSLVCWRDGWEFTKWELRVYEGEAKVLRQPGSGTVAASPPPTAPTVAKQTIDLLALVDLAKDRVGHRNVGANQWARGTNGSLIYTTDGKSGKLVPPISLTATSYEMEVGFRRTSGQGMIVLDLPLDGQPTVISLVLDKAGGRLLNKDAPIWPAGGADNGSITVRCDMMPGGLMKVNVRLGDRPIGEWIGKPRDVAAISSPHPDFPGALVTSLASYKDSYEFTKWELRVFDGEAKVLREQASNPPADLPAWIQPELPAPGPDGWITIFDGKVLRGVQIASIINGNGSVRLENGMLVMDGKDPSLKINVPFPHQDVAVRFTARIGTAYAFGVDVRQNRLGDEEDRFYQAFFYQRGEVALFFYPHSQKIQSVWPALDFKDFIDGEFQAVGDEMKFQAGGRDIVATKRTEYSKGDSFALLSKGGTTYFKSIEVKALSTEARTTPGAGNATSTGITSSNATKDKPFVNALGMKFVPVPITGGSTDGKRVLFSVWETRIQDYGQFVKETGRNWPKPDFEQEPDHPAVKVSWEDARAFCEWLTLRERAAGKIGSDEEYRLPSDHEWSCAVGIGKDEDPAAAPVAKNSKIHAYPWGAEFPPPKGAGNYYGEETRKRNPTAAATSISGYDDGFERTAPVGSFTANALGIHDLGGNVWEWCQDWDDPRDPTRRVYRGVAYDNHKELLSSRRHGYAPKSVWWHGGFRCVLAKSSPTAADP